MSNARNLARLLPDSSGKIQLPSQVAGVLPDANAPSGSVIQVVQTVKTNAFTSVTKNAFTDIAGMSATITPTNAANKVLVTINATCSGQAGVSSALIRLMRGNTAICVGDSAGSRSPSSTISYQQDAGQSDSTSISFLDYPATISATTYKIQFWINDGLFSFNCSQNDGDAAYSGRYASTITLQEIAA